MVRMTFAGLGDMAWPVYDDNNEAAAAAAGAAAPALPANAPVPLSLLLATHSSDGNDDDLNGGNGAEGAASWRLGTLPAPDDRDVPMAAVTTTTTAAAPAPPRVAEMAPHRPMRADSALDLRWASSLAATLRPGRAHAAAALTATIHDNKPAAAAAATARRRDQGSSAQPLAAAASGDVDSPKAAAAAAAAVGAAAFALTPPPPLGMPLGARVRAGLYIASNVLATVGIVFANKLVLTTFAFAFPVTLTLVHALATAGGMELMARAGLFEKRAARPAAAAAPVAVLYVFSIVLSNASIRLNTVGFYQLCKVLVTPALLLVEYAWLRRAPTRAALAATAVLVAGITLATVLDEQVAANPAGAAVGLASTFAAAGYQALASRRQAQLGLDATQLLHQTMPTAAALLAALAPCLEPPREVLAWLSSDLTPAAALALAASSALGLAVSLSAFLVIGATSALTYNVASHLKTVLILGGGVAFFGDALGPAKCGGLGMAMVGLIAYSFAPPARR